MAKLHTARLLLEHGANVNATAAADRQMTALMLAATLINGGRSSGGSSGSGVRVSEERARSLVHLLLQYGADAWAENSTHETALDIALRRVEQSNTQPIAARDGCVDARSSSSTVRLSVARPGVAAAPSAGTARTSPSSDFEPVVVAMLRHAMVRNSTQCVGVLKRHIGDALRPALCAQMKQVKQSHGDGGEIAQPEPEPAPMVEPTQLSTALLVAPAWRGFRDLSAEGGGINACYDIQPEAWL